MFFLRLRLPLKRHFWQSKSHAKNWRTWKLKLTHFREWIELWNAWAISAYFVKVSSVTFKLTTVTTEYFHRKLRFTKFSKTCHFLETTVIETELTENHWNCQKVTISKKNCRRARFPKTTKIFKTNKKRNFEKKKCNFWKT